jgi:hypothetical protein
MAVSALLRLRLGGPVITAVKNIYSIAENRTSDFWVIQPV